MKIQDLRIGNTFIVNGWFAQITAIYQDEVFWKSDKKEGFCKPEELSPIVLKPNILAYIGFENQISSEWSNFDWGYKKYGENFYSLCIEAKDGFYFYTAGEGLKLSIPMMFLHELQNVCYFATGFEIGQDIDSLG